MCTLVFFEDYVSSMIRLYRDFRRHRSTLFNKHILPHFEGFPRTLLCLVQQIDYTSSDISALIVQGHFHQDGRGCSHGDRGGRGGCDGRGCYDEEVIKVEEVEPKVVDRHTYNQNGEEGYVQINC